ncbi:unnamed protein product [Rotaria magnacalcarata]|uniref:Uncharacterized protein n=2 Tax=Rotaria magnacalcarata TaxID=392030 RepID=A0A815BTY1_9BILA|nr:unnamed protein product [Rotaria magnacalcarata]
MQKTISRGYFRLFAIFFLFHTIYPSTLASICPDTLSCNCTLINNTDLNIVCSSVPSLTQLPTLSPSTLQTNVKTLSVISSVTSTNGPLISLPTNICSYPNLATINLSSNNIDGLLNTSALACLGSNLNHVDFSSNHINDIDLNFFQANRKLQTINLSQNNLTSMPLVDAAYYVNFPSTITSMDFSFNQIISVDFWPLFVRTKNTMTIDMSYNSVVNYTNTVPITLEQLTETPDPRKFYLNNNRLTHFSDLLLEQYGACTVENAVSTAYFIVGITNVLLTNNSLICDCESYNIITYINNGIDDFPDISNGSALITQATCSGPSLMAGQKYIATNFSEFNDCINYTLPNITDIFCSVKANDSQVTLSTPTYWPTSTTTTTNKYETNQTIATNDELTNNSSNSTSWYIVLGVVLGLAGVLAVIIAIFYGYRKKILSNIHRLKAMNHVQTNEAKSHNVSMSTSTYEVDNQGKRTQIDKDGFNSDPNSSRYHHLFLAHGSQSQGNNYKRYTLYRKCQLFTLGPSTDATTNTANVVKGIPLSGAQAKPQSIFSMTNKNDSQLNIASIPLTPSKRAKPLPQIKNAIYNDTSQMNLLNTSAGAPASKPKHRPQSSTWLQKQNQNQTSQLPPRPLSMVAHKKTLLDSTESFDENIRSVSTIESLKNKSSKPFCTAPTLNISTVPNWIDSSDDQL